MLRKIILSTGAVARIARLWGAGLWGITGHGTEATFRDLKENQLGGLARFYEGDKEVDRDEFHAFAGTIVQQRGIQALDWVPSIPATGKGGAGSAGSR